MPLYGGIDLHSNSNQSAILGEDRKRIMKRKLPNDPALILRFWEPYKADLVGIVVESTYNWYWLVDLLQENGYRVHLANPAAIQKYNGLKHADDNHDAFWLAELLLLGILPEGYIYPKESRAVRDLLRKRQQLRQLRTCLILSLQNIVTRNGGPKLSAQDLKTLKEDRAQAYLQEFPELLLAGSANKACIDALTQQMARIEAVVETKLKLQEPYLQLLTLPGVGRILGSTIMLETGPISRFSKVGCYASYCRKVNSRWTSNEKVKGHGNKKNGNKYLAWAFGEAAERARLFHRASREFYQRKLRQKKNAALAHGALAHKLARAAFYILRDKVAFQQEKMFGYSEVALGNIGRDGDPGTKLVKPGD
jgi:transposase